LPKPLQKRRKKYIRDIAKIIENRTAFQTASLNLKNEKSKHVSFLAANSIIFSFAIKKTRSYKIWILLLFKRHKVANNLAKSGIFCGT
jgi:hypothetical protein